MSGPLAFGFWPTCHAAYSRLVDRRCRVPDPEQDWHAGRIQRENTPAEQAFVDAMLNVCERDRIDTIFPSNDPWIYVLAKNRELFAEHGVLVPLPDYETVLKPLDKYQTIRCAQEAGFPTPRTYLPESDEDFERIIAETPSPWMVRPRFTSGGRGMKIVTEACRLKATARATAAAHGTPMIQEYIPGRGTQSYYIVLDRSGLPISVVAPKVVRVTGRVLRNSTGASVTAANAPFAAEAVRLLARIGWWGGATIQTKTDARDGMPKLMEINPRCGTQLWSRTEIGINEPLLWLRIARGESPIPVVAGEDYPLGRLMLDPFADFMNFFVALADLGVYRFRTKVLGKKSVDPASPPTGLAEMLRIHRDEYFGPHDRVYHPSFRYLLQDPRPCLLWFTKKVQSAAIMLGEGVGR
jgi:biotin carboxylase